MTLTLLSPNPTPYLPWLNQVSRTIVAVPPMVDIGTYPAPFVLDTIAITPGTLCRRLTDLTHRPVIAIIHPDDQVTPMLLRLAPWVVLICTIQSPAPLLATWVHWTANLVPSQATPHGPCFLEPLRPPPPRLLLPPHLLQLLPAMESATTWEHVADTIYLSPRQLRRIRANLQKTFHLPKNRWPPRLYAAAIVETLATLPRTAPGHTLGRG